MKRYFLVIILTLMFSSNSDACRFWVAVGDDLDKEMVVDQLINEPHSLKNLGEKYQDGWSVGFYDDGDDVIVRGDEASNYNNEFDEAVRYVAVLEPDIIMSHLRRASSGCVNGVPNPHPFRVKYNQKNWLFGHNGGMRKQILIDLIGKDFLEKFPPSVCTDDPPHSWIDSELYFLLIMKTIEEYDDDIKAGIMATINKLYSKIEHKNRYLNFFMSDGESVWVFRKGNTLFYRFDPEKRTTLVSSTIPDESPDEWKEFPEDTLAHIAPNQFPQFYLLEKMN